MARQIVEGTTRRDFLKHTGRLAAAATIVSATAPHVHAAQDSTIRVALVGCGGRGNGAAVNALSVRNGPIQLVAMADVLPEKLSGGHKGLGGQFDKQRFDVPEDRRFIGFDGYRKAMDCLRPGDVVILATPPVFRWVHFKYAMDKGLNVFMEKPVSVDAPTSVKMFDLAKESVNRNQKVVVGLMCRHCRARGEMARRIKKDLQPTIRAVYDDTGGIGKLYARQDEIGTPFCVTVDHESLEDNAVTVRDRDTWAQERISVDQLRTFLLERLM